ncbi:hypothetical protein PRZ48_012902 [Zasmidium cellare]|uniref:Uncharacterized protein n=1 Tax=Zasmidium cellare TaxID=395010 RepID=A0ABR0E2I5_ZASCE|nr:hypothetical protein PRZ48_012902 [Zasmidium cellare]
MTSRDENKSQSNMPQPPPVKPLSEKRKAAWAALAADKETVAMIQRHAKESTHFVPTVQDMNVRDQDESQKKPLTVQQQFQKDLEFLYGDRVLEKLGIKIDENGEASKVHKGGEGKEKTKEQD